METEEPKHLCSNCYYLLPDCPIFRAAREMMISFIMPELFGCLWYTTHQEAAMYGDRRDNGIKER